MKKKRPDFPFSAPKTYEKIQKDRQQTDSNLEGNESTVASSLPLIIRFL